MSSPQNGRLTVSAIAPALIQNAEAVVRHSDVRYIIESPRQYTMQVSETVTLLGPSGWYPTLRISYDAYSKAKFNEATIYDARGEVVKKISKKEITDESYYDGFSVYSDNRYLKVDMSFPKYPYTVEYSYEVKYDETFGYRDWWPQDFDVAVENASLTVETAPGYELLTKQLNEGVEYTESVANGKQLRKWSVENLAPISHEVNGYQYYEILPGLILQPAEFEVAGYKGSMRNWNDYGKFIYELNKGRDQVSFAMKGEVKKLAATKPSKAEKIRTIYEYLQKTTRYVSVQWGIGGWQTFEATYVEQNKYGDCKALTYFMKGMLKEMDIEAYPALISHDRDRLFVEEFAAPLFNHVILYVPETDTWLECTSDYNPPGYIGEGNSNKTVLLITPEGGKIVKTPDAAITASRTSTLDSLYITGDIWKIHGTGEFHGADHEVCRYVQNFYNDVEKEEFFRDNFSTSIRQLNALSISASSDSAVGTCTYEASLEHFGSASGNRYFLPVMSIYARDADCKGNQRSQPIRLKLPLREYNRVVIQIPAGYVVENIPEAISVSDENIGDYSLQITSDDGFITATRRLERSAVTLEAEDFTRLCDFRQAVRRGDRSTVVLHKSP